MAEPRSLICEAEPATPIECARAVRRVRLRLATAFDFPDSNTIVVGIVGSFDLPRRDVRTAQVLLGLRHELIFEAGLEVHSGASSEQQRTECQNSQHHR